MEKSGKGRMGNGEKKKKGEREREIHGKGKK